MGTQKWGTHPYGRMESNKQMDNPLPRKVFEKKVLIRFYILQTDLLC